VKLMRNGMGKVNGQASQSARQRRVSEGSLREQLRRLNVNGTGASGGMASSGMGQAKETPDSERVEATGRFEEEPDAVA
jgi:hypothetical protein